MPACPNCGYTAPPPEPPLGTVVVDRHGATHVRYIDADQRDGWGPGPGFYAFAKWDAMWKARGPLEVVTSD